MKEFTPRLFEALVNEYGLDDLGASGITFKVQSIKKGKIYKEINPEYHSIKSRGFLVDDNGITWNVDSREFKKRFKEIKDGNREIR